MESLGRDREGAQVFGVTAGLFLGVVGVEVGSFGFEDAERAFAAGEDVIGAAAFAVEFETDATAVEEIPAAISEGLVDQDTGKCFRLGRQAGASIGNARVGAVRTG
jgi:hypothetical protein